MVFVLHIFGDDRFVYQLHQQSLGESFNSPHPKIHLFAVKWLL